MHPQKVLRFSTNCNFTLCFSLRNLRLIQLLLLMHTALIP